MEEKYRKFVEECRQDGLEVTVEEFCIAMYESFEMDLTSVREFLTGRVAVERVEELVEYLASQA